jgi:hypothetical protein
MFICHRVPQLYKVSALDGAALTSNATRCLLSSELSQ